MSEKFELLPVDIDLTERNIFGRSNNEFQPQLEDLSRIPDGIEEVEGRLAPVQSYGNQMRYYRSPRYNITQTYSTNNTTTNTIANYYTIIEQYTAIQPVTIDVLYENTLGGPSSFVITNRDASIIRIDEVEPIIKIGVGDIISEFRADAGLYVKTGAKTDDIYDAIHKIQALHPAYVMGHLAGIRTTFRYANNGFNSEWTYTSSSYDDIDSYYIELEPPCVEELDDLDIHKCYKDKYALIAGKSSEYMRKVYRWCEILRLLIPPKEKEDMPSVDLDRYDEFKIEFSTTRDQYNGISDYDWFGLKYYRPFPAMRSNLSYNSRLRCSDFYYHHKHYSELPGLYVTDEYIAESYPDIFRQDSYNDRGLHLLELKVPQYTVIEYDLEAMDAIEPDEYDRFSTTRFGDRHPEHMYYERIIERKE